MKRFKYPALVIKEAKMLKKLTTEEEKQNLNVSRLNPDSMTSCIYGMLCGNCFSERAKELIEASCARVYSTYGDFDNSKINGSPKGKFRTDDSGRNSHWGQSKTSYFSPIEIFIYRNRNKRNLANQRLVQYLKGEIKTL